MNYNVQHVFELAKETISKIYNLELTLSDQIRLRREYVEKIIPLAKVSNENGCKLTNLDPCLESAVSFLQDYYGLPMYHVGRGICSISEAREYLQIVQEKFFRP